MAFVRRGGFAMNAPRVITFAISLILVVAAVVSLHFRLPVSGSFVSAHRFWIVVAGYVVLALGCVLRGL